MQTVTEPYWFIQLWPDSVCGCGSLVILQGWEKDTGDVGDWEIKMQHGKIQQRTVLDQKT